MRGLKLSFHHLVTLGLILASLFLAASYGLHFVRSSPAEETHDTSSHIAYIQYIMDKHALPKAGDCFVCYHPPTYYLVSASIAELVAPSLSLKAVQLLSVLCFALFLAFSSATLRLVLPSDRAWAVATLLVAAWPTSIFHSARIGNDLPLYAAQAAGFFYLVLAWQRGVSRDWTRAAALSWVAIWIKGNGCILFALVAWALIWRSLQARSLKGRHWAHVFLLAGGLSLALQGSAARSVSLIGNKGFLAATAPQTRVSNDVATYLSFKWDVYFGGPGASQLKDAHGRNYFWNTLAETALTTRFRSSSRPPAADLILKILFLGLLAAALIGAAMAVRERLPTWPLLIASTLLPLAAILTARIAVPFSAVNDFRYIFPMIVPFSAGVGYASHRLPRFWAYAIMIASAVFAGVSCLFYLLPPQG